MTYSKVWVENKPGGDTPADLIDEEIRSARTAIRERIEQMLPGWTDDAVDPKRFPHWIVLKDAFQDVDPNIRTAVTWDGDVLSDTDEFFDELVNNQIVIPAGLGGLYYIASFIKGAPNANASANSVFIRVNGMDVSLDRKPMPDEDFLYPTKLAILNGSDTVQIMLEHDDTVSLNPGITGGTLFGPNVFLGVRLAG